MRRRKTLGKSVANYSTLAIGASAGLFAGESSDAAVVPFNPPGGPATIYSYLYDDPHILRFDIDGDGVDDFNIYAEFYFGNFGIANGVLTSELTNLIMNDGSLAAIVAPGGTVGPDSSGWPNRVRLDNFDGTRGYAGVVFDIPGGSPHFGYLDIAVAADRSSLTLYGGAYESIANTPITTPVPEPAPLLLLSSGAAGLAAWRRRNDRRDSTSMTRLP
jgi:hypothetical protein